MNAHRIDESPCARWKEYWFMDSESPLCVPVRYAVGQLLEVGEGGEVVAVAAVDRWTQERVVLLRCASPKAAAVRIQLSRQLEGDVQQISIAAAWWDDERDVNFPFLLRTPYTPTNLLTCIQLDPKKVPPPQFLSYHTVRILSAAASALSLLPSQLAPQHLLLVNDTGTGNTGLRLACWEETVWWTEAEEHRVCTAVGRLLHETCFGVDDGFLQAFCAACDSPEASFASLLSLFPEKSVAGAAVSCQQPLFPCLSRGSLKTFLLAARRCRLFPTGRDAKSLRLVCAFWCVRSVLPPPTAASRPCPRARPPPLQPFSWGLESAVSYGWGEGEEEADMPPDLFQVLQAGFLCLATQVGEVMAGKGRAATYPGVGWQCRGSSSDGSYSEIVEYDGYSVRHAPKEVAAAYDALLDLSSCWFDHQWKKAELRGSVLRVTWYQGGSDVGVVSCPPHADMSLLTVATASSPGFEVRSPSGVWRTLPEVHRLLIFPGKLATMATNGRVFPLAHRVTLPPGSQSRLSVTFFCRLAPYACIQDPLTAFRFTGCRIQYILNDLPKSWRDRLSSMGESCEDLAVAVAAFSKLRCAR